jgi:hypothetical protein
MRTKTILSIILLTTLFNTSCFSNKVGPASDEKIISSPALVERGKYLVYHVSLCIDCHSAHNENIFGRPEKPGTEGQGGELFGKEAGFPGNIYARNITPYGIGDWTDGEVIRAITTGVSKDGHALFPLMPYGNFGKMAKDDIYAIVAYIRTLKPVKNDVPPTKLDFPLNFIVNSMPKPADPQTRPDEKSSVAYGKYMVNASGCFICHTKMNKGTPLEGMEYAGGEEFPLPGRGIVRAANITPDKATGIGTWSREQFIARFKAYDTPAAKNLPVKDKEFQTVMPWMYFNGKTEEDLGAIYDFLRTVKPIENKVEKFSALP